MHAKDHTRRGQTERHTLALSIAKKGTGREKLWNLIINTEKQHQFSYIIWLPTISTSEVGANVGFFAGLRFSVCSSALRPEQQSCKWRYLCESWMCNGEKKYLKKIMFSWEEKKPWKLSSYFFCTFYSIHTVWEYEAIAKINFPFFALAGSFFPPQVHLCDVRQFPRWKFFRFSQACEISTGNLTISHRRVWIWRRAHTGCWWYHTSLSLPIVEMWRM